MESAVCGVNQPTTRHQNAFESSQFFVIIDSSVGNVLSESGVNNGLVTWHRKKDFERVRGVNRVNERERFLSSFISP